MAPPSQFHNKQNIIYFLLPWLLLNVIQFSVRNMRKPYYFIVEKRAFVLGKCNYICENWEWHQFIACLLLGFDLFDIFFWLIILMKSLHIASCLVAIWYIYIQSGSANISKGQFANSAIIIRSIVIIGNSLSEFTDCISFIQSIDIYIVQCKKSAPSCQCKHHKQF